VREKHCWLAENKRLKAQANRLFQKKKHRKHKKKKKNKKKKSLVFERGP
jgi:hypothetical protein